MKTSTIINIIVSVICSITSFQISAQQRPVLSTSYERIPIAPAVTNTLVNKTVCAGSNTFFYVTSNGSLPLTFKWQRNNIDIAGSNNDTIYINNISTANTGSYRCIVSNSCSVDTSNSALLTIPLVNAGFDQVVCATTTITLDGVVSTATDGVWSGGLGTFTPDEFALNAVYTPTAVEISTGTVTLTLTSTGNGTCTPVTDNVTITITPAPIVNAGNGSSVCQNNFPIHLAGSVSIATGGVWTVGAGNSIPNETLLNAYFTPSASQLSDGTVTLTLTSTGNGNCVAETDQVTYQLFPSPIVYAGADQDICQGSSVILYGSGADSYIWSNGISDNNSFVPTTTNSYIVTGFDANNCTNKDTVKITVNPIYSINNPITICEGENYSINGNSYSISGIYHDTLST